jgi:hypothetical protein
MEFLRFITMNRTISKFINGEKNLEITLFTPKVMFEKRSANELALRFPVVCLRFSKVSMEYYNLNRKDMVDTGMAGKADSKGMVDNNIQILDLEPIMHQ